MKDSSYITTNRKGEKERMEEMKPVIFLDFDGVICNRKERLYIDGEYDFIPEAVEAINELRQALDAEYVIISSWRIGRRIEQLQDILEVRGVEGKVIGKTESSYTSVEGGRGQEIREWMEQYGLPETFLILDNDVKDIRNHFKNWYQTDPTKCLRKSEVPQILSRLERLDH